MSSTTGDYLFGPRIDEPLAQSRGSVASYYDVDALGSAASLDDAAASIENSYTFDSWGVTRNQTGSVTNSFTYTRPTRVRISDTGGTVVTRPTSPRLICRMPSKISFPIFRLRFLIIFNLLLDLPQNMSGYVFRKVLWIKRQQPLESVADSK